MPATKNLAQIGETRGNDDNAEGKDIAPMPVETRLL